MCGGTEMLSPNDIKSKKIKLILPQDPEHDHKEVFKCIECIKDTKISRFLRSIGDIPEELQDLTAAEDALISPYAPVVQYCINSKG